MVIMTMVHNNVRTGDYIVAIIILITAMFAFTMEWLANCPRCLMEKYATIDPSLSIFNYPYQLLRWEFLRILLTCSPASKE